MTVERSQVGCRSWLEWILASTIGLPAGFALGLFLDQILFKAVPLDWKTEQVVGVLIIYAMIGAISGITQFFVLEEHVPRAGWWILPTAAAWILVCGFLGGGRVVDVRYIFGVLIGILQWLILRRHVPRAGLWVVASAVAWTLGFEAGFHRAEEYKFDGAAFFAMLCVIGLVYSVITGGALVWLLRQSAPEA